VSLIWNFLNWNFKNININIKEQEHIKLVAGFFAFFPLTFQMAGCRQGSRIDPINMKSASGQTDRGSKLKIFTTDLQV
jgi:hypothetical protein